MGGKLSIDLKPTKVPDVPAVNEFKMVLHEGFHAVEFICDRPELFVELKFILRSDTPFKDIRETIRGIVERFDDALDSVVNALYVEVKRFDPSSASYVYHSSPPVDVEGDRTIIFTTKIKMSIPKMFYAGRLDIDWILNLIKSKITEFFSPVLENFLSGFTLKVELEDIFFEVSENLIHYMLYLNEGEYSRFKEVVVSKVVGEEESRVLMDDGEKHYVLAALAVFYPQVTTQLIPFYILPPKSIHVEISEI